MVRIGDFHLSSLSTRRLKAERFEESTAFLLSEYGGSPYGMNIDCLQNVHSKHGKNVLVTNIIFDEKNYDLERFGITLQRSTIVEEAAIGIAFLLFPDIVEGEITRVTQRGERLDYQINYGDFLLEISGTELANAFKSRHTKKVEQGKENHGEKDYFVVVCCFSTHETIFSFHKVKK